MRIELLEHGIYRGLYQLLGLHLGDIEIDDSLVDLGEWLQILEYLCGVLPTLVLCPYEDRDRRHGENENQSDYQFFVESHNRPPYVLLGTRTCSPGSYISIIHRAIGLRYALKPSFEIYISTEMKTIHLPAPSFEVYAEEGGKVPEYVFQHPVDGSRCVYQDDSARVSSGEAEVPFPHPLVK